MPSPEPIIAEHNIKLVFTNLPRYARCTILSFRNRIIRDVTTFDMVLHMGASKCNQINPNAHWTGWPSCVNNASDMRVYNAKYVCGVQRQPITQSTLMFPQPFNSLATHEGTLTSKTLHTVSILRLPCSEHVRTLLPLRLICLPTMHQTCVRSKPDKSCECNVSLLHNTLVFRPPLISLTLCQCTFPVRTQNLTFCTSVTTNHFVC